MKKLDLLVVLQSHSISNRDNSVKRFCGGTKSEVTKRCVHSLVESLIEANNSLPNFNLRFKIFDDHSDSETLEFLKSLLSRCSFESSLTHLETRGVMPSILKCYEYGKNYGLDLVYFAQDDYLYEKTAIRDMVWTCMQSSNNLKSPVSIFPYNDPYHYAPVNTEISSHIIQSGDRHWRTNLLTASCFMTHHSIIKKEWDLFEKMGNSDPFDPTMEDNSINLLFKLRGYFLLIPIPSLAFHMQTESEKDPFADWKSLWNKNKIPTFDITLDSNKKYFFNLGSGKTPIQDTGYADDFRGFEEIRVDANEDCDPDIVADILNLTHIPSNVADKIFTQHCLEHIDSFNTKMVIQQMYRILKPSGTLKIVVPNLKAVAKNIVDGKLFEPLYQSSIDTITAHDIIFGYSKFLARDKQGFERHKTGFTKEIFEKLLTEFNYKFKVQELPYDVVVEIYKDNCE